LISTENLQTANQVAIITKVFIRVTSRNRKSVNLLI